MNTLQKVFVGVITYLILSTLIYFINPVLGNYMALGILIVCLALACIVIYDMLGEI